MIYVYLADGFEDIEAIVPIDLLRRAGANVATVSISDTLAVKSSHNVIINADIYASDVDLDKAELIFLPGGSEGTEALASSQLIREAINYAETNGIYIASICAAPSIPGRMGLLDGRNIACYPGMESFMPSANVTGNSVEKDDLYITGESAGASFEFALKLVEILFGVEKASTLKDKIRYKS